MDHGPGVGRVSNFSKEAISRFIYIIPTFFFFFFTADSSFLESTIQTKQVILIIIPNFYGPDLTHGVHP